MIILYIDEWEPILKRGELAPGMLNFKLYPYLSDVNRDTISP